MSERPDPADAVGVIFPTGMLGGGFSPQTIENGIALGAAAIAVDAGSTDSGPHYLGTGTAKTTRAAVERDLRILLIAARRADIPLVVTSCGTSGTDAGVEWIAEIAEQIATQENLHFTLARIYSEQSPAHLLTALNAGRIRPLPPARALDATTLRSCTHIVGLMGHAPIATALDAGADVVLAGRATDTASVAALALRRGLPAGPAWHAAKTVECGGQCTTDPSSGGVYVEIDQHGFTVQPLDPNARCTPTSVAAHMLYENADPHRLREPAGTLDTTQATYTALDPRTVRVEGSRFEAAEQPTIKLEGAARADYETIALVGIRDPQILADLGTWTDTFAVVLADRVRAVLGLEPDQYRARLRSYGHSAVLGDLELHDIAPHEVGILLTVRAVDQATASAIAKIANPLLLHLPLPGMDHFPSFALAFSPAEIERGAAYEFVLNHAVDVDDETALFHTTLSKVPHV